MVHGRAGRGAGRGLAVGDGGVQLVAVGTNIVATSAVDLSGTLERRGGGLAVAGRGERAALHVRAVSGGIVRLGVGLVNTALGFERHWYCRGGRRETTERRQNDFRSKGKFGRCEQRENLDERARQSVSVHRVRGVRVGAAPARVLRPGVSARRRGKRSPKERRKWH
jgi:hypothetical protein